MSLSREIQIKLCQSYAKKSLNLKGLIQRKKLEISIVLKSVLKHSQSAFKHLSRFSNILSRFSNILSRFSNILSRLSNI